MKHAVFWYLTLMERPVRKRNSTVIAKGALFIVKQVEISLARRVIAKAMYLNPILTPQGDTYPLYHSLLIIYESIPCNSSSKV